MYIYIYTDTYIYTQSPNSSLAEKEKALNT